MSTFGTNREPTSVAGATSDEMRVRHVMTNEVISVAPDTSVQEIAETLIRNRISSVPVVDRAGRLIGIVNDGDLIRRVEIGTEPRRSWWQLLLTDAMAAAHVYVRSHGRTARDVMTLDAVTTKEEAPLHKVAALMARKGLRGVPVLRGGRVVGILSRTDLVRKLASFSAASVGPGAVER